MAMSDLISRADAIEAVRGLSVLVDDKDFSYFENALNALPSAEAKGDLISREDAKKAFCRINDLRTLSLGKVGEVLDSLLSAEAVQGWIPCSERLPERDEIVLVSYKTEDTVQMCKYLDDGSENPWWSYNDDCLAWNNVILAWMPLPMPYREDGE